MKCDAINPHPPVTNIFVPFILISLIRIIFSDGLYFNKHSLIESLIFLTFGYNYSNLDVSK